MKVYIVLASPDPRSFNASLVKDTVKHLEEKGNEVRVTDLYGEKVKSVVDEDDFLNHEKGTRFHPVRASRSATEEGKLTPDVYKAQDNLIWADMVILQFPIWWFSMPAIMKGWFDRVLSQGFGYGLKGPSVLAGKKAMVSVTAGGADTYYGERGISGPLEDLLFPITHGLLAYLGFSVFPSYAVYRVDRADDKKLEEAKKGLFDILDNIDSIKPIPFRSMASGDYELPSLELKEGKEQPGERGFSMHIVK